MGSTIDSLNQPLNITWDSTCLSCQEIDIYLYAPNSPLPRIHVWANLALDRSFYSAQLLPRWWNSTQSEQLQIIIVPSGDPPFLSTFPAGPVFTATYSPPASLTSPPPAADTSIVDSGITRVNDLANQQATKKAISSRTAAAVLIPLIFIALAIAAFVRWKRRQQHQKRQAWTEKVDKRMSTISTEWKSVSAAGAQAAIRNSIAVASRNSSFSFGAIRPASSALDPSDDDGQNEKLKSDHPVLRSGTGVGLRNPNGVSAHTGGRSSTASTTRGVSRVSFAPDPRVVSRVSFADSTTTANVPSRAFHSAFVPPVPALPNGVSASTVYGSESLSPRQSAGPLSLTSDDIKARIAATASGKPAKGSVSALDDFLPALSCMCFFFFYLIKFSKKKNSINQVMRTGNNNMESDDLLFSPQFPEPAYSPSSASITAAFPAPPSTTSPPSSASPSTTIVLSPDEMLRAYAERKKSLADAAKAGRIGGPLRVSSGVPSLAGSAATTMTTSGGGGGGARPMSRVETISSIHETGMRVAYGEGAVYVPNQNQQQQQAGSTTMRGPTLPLVLRGHHHHGNNNNKGIEGGKALLGKVKSFGKKKKKQQRKSVNPFVKVQPEEEAEEEEGGYENPGEAYVAAVEAEAEQQRHVGAHAVGDDVVGAYPFAYEERGYFGQYAGQEEEEEGQQQQQQQQGYYGYRGEVQEGKGAYGY